MCLAGCNPQLGVPTDASISCNAAKSCPSGWACIAAIGECRRPGAACIEEQGGEYAIAADGNRCSLQSGGHGVCQRGACVESVCGDGLLDADAGEECDDRNDVDEDGCLSTCKLNTCGDGYLNPGSEACDDGNQVNEDACRADCQLNVCGDGFVFLGVEACDDGDDDDTDDCLSNCRPAYCGDGAVRAGVEACDDGNTRDGDGCSGDCSKLEVCGDGVVDGGEGCDDGNSNPNDGCDANPAGGGCKVVTWQPSIVFGLGPSGGDPAQLPLSLPGGVTGLRDGTLFVTDTNHHRVVRIDAVSGTATPLAGTGKAGYSGDGGPANAALLTTPTDLAADGKGNLYIAAAGNNAVRRVDASSGQITLVAGSGDGTSGLGASDVPALGEPLDSPNGIFLDLRGNLYIADTNNSQIRRVDSETGVVTTVAGDGTAGAGESTSPLGAVLDHPTSVCLNNAGEMFIADTVNTRVAKVDALGLSITTYVGFLGTQGDSGDDGSPDAALLMLPTAVVCLADGSLLVVDSGAHRLRRVAADGSIITAFAGTGTAGATGDGSLATAAELNAPQHAWEDLHGRVFIADTNNRRVRRVDAAGVIDSVAGQLAQARSDDGVPARRAGLFRPRSVAVDSIGRVFIADTFNNRIRVVDPGTGLISTYAGTGEPVSSGDGGLASQAQIFHPEDIELDEAHGWLYVVESIAHRIRRIRLGSGFIYTVAGTGVPGYTGDGGQATLASLYVPSDVAVAANGDLYVADTYNQVVRRIEAGTLRITTVAGTGSVGAFVDAAADATTVPLYLPQGVAVAGTTLYIADSNNKCIRAVDLGTGSLTTVAGRGTLIGNPVVATSAEIDMPVRLLVMSTGDLLFSTNDHRVDYIKFGATNLVYMFGGRNDSPGAAGDGGSRLGARFYFPKGLAEGPSGEIYVADQFNDRVRVVKSIMVDTFAGAVESIGDGPLASAQLSSPAALTAAYPDHVVVADGNTGRVRAVDWTAQTLDTLLGYPSNIIDPPSIPANYARLLQDAAGVVYLPSDNAFLVSERGGNTIRRLSVGSSLGAADSSVTTYAGKLPREICCAIDVPTNSCDSGEKANPACSDSSPGFFDGPVDGALFDGPAGMAYDPADPTLGQVVYVADSNNHVIRRIALSAGEVSTIAGVPGAKGYYGDGVGALAALFDTPMAVAVGPNQARVNGSLYIADTKNHRVRRLDLDSGILTNVLGDGTAGSSGEGQPARGYPVDSPQALAVDSYGNLFVSSRVAIRLVAAGSDGVATGDDKVMTVYGAAPRDNFPESVTRCLGGVDFDRRSSDDGRLFLADRCLGLFLQLDRVTVP